MPSSSPSASVIRVFLDFEVGDAAVHATRTAAFTRFEDFALRVAAPQLGFDTDELHRIEDFQDDQLELVSELFQAQHDDDDIVQRRPESLRVGQVIIELDAAGCPRATENFRCLCTGEKGTSKVSGKPLHLKASRVHRVQKNFVMQAGDVAFGDGSGGESIYGARFGKDETAGLKRRHEPLGSVAMANNGKPNSSSGQFYITIGDGDPADDASATKKFQKLDGKHVVFGKVVEGHDVLKKIAAAVATESGTPLMGVRIADSGQLKAE